MYLATWTPNSSQAKMGSFMLACTQETRQTKRRRSTSGQMLTAGGTHAKLVYVRVIADPGEVLPDALAQRHVLDVRVLVAEVMRAADVKGGERGQAAQHGQAGRGLQRVSCRRFEFGINRRANNTSEVSVCSQPPSSLSSTTFSLEVTQGGMTCEGVGARWHGRAGCCTPCDGKEICWWQQTLE